jgi:hypothetical protein
MLCMFLSIVGGLTMKKNKLAILLASAPGRSAQGAGQNFPGRRTTKQLSALTAGLLTALVLATASTRADAAEEWEFALSPLFLWGLVLVGFSV